jgi:ribosome recycling factor
MVNDVVSDFESSCAKVIENFKKELAKVRTGRANVSMLDGIKVDYYGTMTPLNQVATLNVPDPRLITIKPWEKALVPLIEKSIKVRTELNLNPVADGELVRVPIPALTQERRKDLVKVVKGMNEDAKVAIRNARRDANELLKSLLGDGDITEDDQKRGLKSVQDVTDKNIAGVDEIAGKKEKEILEG